jgi:integrase/recombinase XerD
MRAMGDANTPVSAAIVLAPAEVLAHDARDAELVESYLGTLQSDKSVLGTRESLRRIARTLGFASELDVPWTRLQFDELHAIRRALADKYAPSSANMTLSALRQIIKIAFVLGHVDARAYEGVKSLKSIQGSRLPRGRALSIDEERRLLAYLQALPGYRGVMLPSAVAVSIGGGLRREEICRLALEADVGTSLRVLGKANKERAVTLDIDTRAALDAWIKRRRFLNVDHQALFCCPQRPDRPLTKLAWWEAVREAADAAGVVFSGPHDFRRTFATRLLNQGLDLFEVQELMGHKDPSTTKIYDKRAIEKLHDKRSNMRILAVSVPLPAPAPPPAPPKPKERRIGFV